MFFRIKPKRKTYFIVYYIVLVIIMVMIFRQYASEQIEKELIGSLEDLSQQNITLIQNKLNEKCGELRRLAEEIVQSGEYDPNNFDYAKTEKYLEQVSKVLGFIDIVIALPDGTAYDDIDSPYNLSDREYFKRSMNGEVYVTETLNDRRDGAKINIYSVPIKDNSEKIIGVLFGINDTTYFVDNFEMSMFDGNGYTYVIDSEGDIVPGSSIQSLAMTNLIDNLGKYPENEKAISSLLTILKGEKSDSLYINNNGYEYANFNPLNINDWWLVTIVPEKVLEERVTTITYGVQVLSICIMLGAVVILVFFIKMQRKSEEYLKNIAYTDQFTGLYNKTYFEENFLQNIKSIQEKQAALVLYNIRKFKMVNEIYGENAGDIVLHKVSCVLKDNIKNDKEMVMHQHADEFAALYFYKTKEELENRIRNIIQDMEIIECKNNQIKLNMAVGIYEVQNLSYSFERIYNYANIAKKQSKNSDTNMIEYYSEELKNIEIHKKQLNDSIREGIRKKEFKAWFQPKFDADTGKVIGAEALARWYKEDGQILSPFHFVEFSEKVGLIQEIDELIIEDVCIKMNEWKKQGIPCIPVSVNLSRAYLNNANSIYSVKKILDKYGISSEYIQLEITESAIVDSEEELSNVIDTMHKLGFTVLLDDFGVGYSSLISINNLNFDILKIDKSFVDTIGTEKGNYITKYIIELGKKLGMDIIAEGVETEDEYTFLKKQKCDMIQGYYFSKPLPSEEFKEVLKG